MFRSLSLNAKICCLVAISAGPRLSRALDLNKLLKLPKLIRKRLIQLIFKN